MKLLFLVEITSENIFALCQSSHPNVYAEFKLQLDSFEVLSFSYIETSKVVKLSVVLEAKIHMKLAIRHKQRNVICV